MWHTYKGSPAFGVIYWRSKCERLSDAGSCWHSLEAGGLRRETIPGPEPHGDGCCCSTWEHKPTPYLIPEWHVLCYSKWYQKCLIVPLDLREIQLDASMMDKLEDIHLCEGPEDGREIKGSAVCSGLYAGWTHEHVTDEPRRQWTIWGYIMVLTSRHNAVDNE